LVLLGLVMLVVQAVQSSSGPQITIADKAKLAAAGAGNDPASPLVKALARMIAKKPIATSCSAPQVAPEQPSGVDPPLPPAVSGNSWEIVKGATQLAGWESNGWALGVGVGADGQLLAASIDPGAIRVWRVEDGTPLRSFCAVPNSTLQPVAFTFDGRTLGLALDDGTIMLWRVSDGVVLHIFSGFMGVTSMATTLDGQTLATAMTDGTVSLWRVSDGAHLGMVTTKEPAIGLAIAPDAQTIATVVDGGNGMLFWRVSDGSIVGKADGAESLAFSPDGQLLAAGSNQGPIALWDVKNDQLLGELTGHTQGVLALAFAPDGRTLVSSSEDSSLRLWGAPR